VDQAVLDLVAAASARLDAFDLESARSLANASLTLVDQPYGHELLGAVAYMDEEHALAQREWELAFDRYRMVSMDRDAARVAVALASMFSSDLHQPALGNGWVERARLQLLRTDPCVEWGYLELAVMACERSDIDDLLGAAERALSLAIEFGDADLEARALADGGLGLVSHGRTREGFARLDAALALINTGRVRTVATGMCFCSMLSACDRSGDLRRAEEWTQLVQGQLAANGDQPRVLRTHCTMVYGSVLCATGQWSAAEQLMNVALGPAERPAIAHRAQTTAHLAALRVDQGRVEEAADLLAEYEDRVTSCAPLARVHLARGELDLAAAVLRRGLQELVGDALRASPLYATLVEVERRRGHVDAARDAAAALADLAARTDLAAVHADACLAEGRVLFALEDVPAALDAFIRAKAHLADDSRPLQLGLIRLEMAEVLAVAGDVAGAVVEGRAALACFERLGAAPARDRASALLRSLGDTGRLRPQRTVDLDSALTQREREVLELVCAGLSNAAIAERLYISPKTAEHHVGRVLTKLGVRSRAEAAALAVRLSAK
jgi:DNA-binding CsgD family transcriptional regulator